MKVDEHVSFQTLTTFKVGGTARYVVTVESVDEVEVAVQFAKEKNLPLIPIGGGSNMLGVDGELPAVLVRVGMQTIVGTEGTITADAGAPWDDVVLRAVEHEWWGIENLSAIPGTMGGAVVQNIGAYGAVLSESLVSVEAFDTHTGAVRTFVNSECGFGYRTSIFKEERDRYIILSATLRLSQTPEPKLSYKDLSLVFQGGDPSLQEIRDAVISIRSKKFPPLAEYGTAGSYFLNPIMNAKEAKVVQEAYPSMPVFQLPEGGVKVPIAWFLDHVLNLRGTKEGFVEAWRDHVLALVAHKGATADEVKNFAKKIIERVGRELQIKVTPEVREL
jgi:UDP-N-acetylmuramate dehydrogenase